jgi:hypothetical protein
MTKKPHVTIHRKDYTPPAYWVNTVEMGFDLDPAATRVATRMTMQRNSASPNKDDDIGRNESSALLSQTLLFKESDP